MKSKYIIVLTLSIAMLTGCGNNYSVPTLAPEITVTLDGSSEAVDEVPYEILLNQWNGAIYNRISSMEAMKKYYEDKGKKMPTGQPHQQVRLEFGPYKPDSITLRRELYEIDDPLEGTKLTTIDLTEDTPVTYIFNLDRDEESATYKYVYTLTVTWGHNSTDYAFAIEVEE